MATDSRPGRRFRPYTDRGVRRLLCARCGTRPAVQQWQCCADLNTWRPICVECDIALNAAVLRFMNDPNWARKMKAYTQRLTSRQQ
jgi:hypothetical protein